MIRSDLFAGARRTARLAAALALAAAAPALRAEPPASPAPVSAGPAAGASADPFAWLEEVHGARALAWVRAENARTAARLETDPRYETFRREALSLFTAPDRLALPELRAGGVDNVWQDAANPHGLWRHASLAAYRSGRPDWTVLLDLDALSRREGKSWFFKGATCLKPAERLCLVALSNGGGDAVELREFDAAARAFVPGGFDFPIAKQSAVFLDADHVLVSRADAPAEATRSGYSAVVKLVARGQASPAAPIIFRGEATDGGGVRARALRDRDGRLEAVLLSRSVSGSDERFALWRPGGPAPVPFDLPRKVRTGPYLEGRLTATLEEPWRGFAAGDVVSTPLDGGPPELVHHPAASETVDEVRAAGGRLVLAVLHEVQGRVLLASRRAGGWTTERLDGIPPLSSVALRAADADRDVAFLTTEGFLEPTALLALDAPSGRLDLVRRLPARFDASRDVVEQKFATSLDGARIPYFLVRPKGMKADGSTPVQMFGYGGFLISETPAYRPEVGKLWLERGGAYVVANIRGGGEFGPAWHEAALKAHRQRAFDDFDAVALDLFRTGVTSPRRLGIYGRSNGGVLMSVSMTQHPDHFRAVVIESPLIDMLRYNHLSAGASWMAEYGNPDLPADRAVIARYSAYQLLKPGVAYPEPYITTNTEDDRVHPGHARKFAAKLQALGDPALYYENSFGGHANDADPELNARRWARHYVYLSQKLMD